MLALWLALHEEADYTAEAANDVGQAAAEHAHHGSKVPELPNLLGVVHNVLYEKNPALAKKLDAFAASWGFADPLGTPFTALETVIFALVVVFALSLFFIMARGKLQAKPKAGQKIAGTAMLVEIVYVFFEDFFGQIVGKKDVRKHLPLVGTLFIYILCCNSFGLIFLGKAPTANLSFNLALAFCVFLYVHFGAVVKDPIGYLKHFPGTLPSIKDLGGMGYFLIPFMAILFTIIHVMELFIQPVSLSLRLYGNVLGKDVLLGVFGSLVPYVPIHAPFLFLGLLLGAIQALIFSLLAAVYITLWEPHTHHEEHHDDAHGAHDKHAHAGAH